MRPKALMMRAKAALAGNRDAAVDDRAGEEGRAPGEIEDLIAFLRAQPPDERRGANVSLTDPGTADAFVAPLLAAARDEDPYIRASAIHALGHYDMATHAQAAQVVHRALAGDRDASIRAAAASALASQSPEAIPALMVAPNDEVAGVRLQAVIALGSMQVHQAIDTLADRIFSDPDEEVRNYAVNALGEMRHAGATQHLIDSLGSLRWAAHPDTTATLQSLCRALSDAEPNVRRSVCGALASLRDARAVPFFAGALSDGDEEAWCKIIEAISRIDAKHHAAAAWTAGG